MSNKTFIVDYEVVLKDNTRITNKQIKVKNCTNDLFAKLKLEKEFISKKYPGYKQLVITSCKEDYLSIFGDMFGNGFTGSPKGNMNMNDVFNIFGGKK